MHPVRREKGDRVRSFFDDLKRKVDGMLKLAVAGAFASGAAMAAFICFAVALFLWMQQNYGTLEAWIALCVLFTAVAALGAIILLTVRRQNKLRTPPPTRETSAVSRMMQDPVVLLTGLQIVRTLGARGLLPIILLGAVVGGLMMNRNSHSERTNHQRPGYEAGEGLH